MPHIIVEYKFDTPPTDEEFYAWARKLDPCLEVRSARWLKTFLALDRTRQICIFEAPDAQSVREAYQSAKVGFERAWAAEDVV
jgi:hypothetical protein